MKKVKIVAPDKPWPEGLKSLPTPDRRLASMALQRNTLRILLSIFSVLLLTMVLCFDAIAKETPWLITPEEAALAPAEEDGVRTRGLSDAGPCIEVAKPAEGEILTGATEILIRFLPKTVTIDLTSLKVTLLKFISIDLTDRLKPYIDAAGINVKDVKVPTGTYRVRISLSDTQGKTTSKELAFEVR
jgi:hypothetical protein